MDKILLSQQTTIAITILIGLFFIWLGYLNNKKIFNNKNYIVGGWGSINPNVDGPPIYRLLENYISNKKILTKNNLNAVNIKGM